MTDQSLHSSKLYRTPSFLKGFARVCDFFGGLDRYLTHHTEEKADTTAAIHDWEIVGHDMKIAIDSYDRQIKTKPS